MSRKRYQLWPTHTANYRCIETSTDSSTTQPCHLARLVPPTITRRPVRSVNSTPSYSGLPTPHDNPLTKYIYRRSSSLVDVINIYVLNCPWNYEYYILLLYTAMSIEYCYSVQFYHYNLQIKFKCAPNLTNLAQKCISYNPFSLLYRFDITVFYYIKCLYYIKCFYFYVMAVKVTLMMFRYFVYWTVVSSALALCSLRFFCTVYHSYVYIITENTGWKHWMKNFQRWVYVNYKLLNICNLIYIKHIFRSWYWVQQETMRMWNWGSWRTEIVSIHTALVTAWLFHHIRWCDVIEHISCTVTIRTAVYARATEMN